MSHPGGLHRVLCWQGKAGGQAGRQAGRREGRRDGKQVESAQAGQLRPHLIGSALRGPKVGQERRGEAAQGRAAPWGLLIAAQSTGWEGKAAAKSAALGVRLPSRYPSVGMPALQCSAVQRSAAQSSAVQRSAPPTVLQNA